MPERLQQTAILIFTRTARLEAAVKTFDQAVGKSGNREIAQQLIRQTIAEARRSRLPVFVNYDDEPERGTFGEHLADAIESVFQKGYDKVIAIGNDCPDVSAALLQNTAQRLSDHTLVLGPANDGGVYLIGIHKAAYRRRTFIALPWESAQLQDAWETYGPDDCASPEWLEAFDDVDHARDFKKMLLRLPRWSRLIFHLLSILASFHRAPVFERRAFRPDAQTRLTPLRGPPC